MAMKIKIIPTLKDEVAQNFNRNADSAVRKKATVDFSKQVTSLRKILSKYSAK